jgi:hypothetical protein
MDKIFNNKYICIAIVVGAVVVIYLYKNKEQCNIEGMKNVDLSMLAPELTEHPWTDGSNQYKLVGNKFDKYADKYVARKLKKEGYYVSKPIERNDQRFEEYMENSGSYKPYRSRKQKRAFKKLGSRKYRDGPRPLDNRPDLSQCQPCGRYKSDSDIYSDSDSESY